MGKAMGKYGKKTQENHKKTMGKGENHRKIIGKWATHRKIIGIPEENMGKRWKTIGKPTGKYGDFY